MQKTRKKTASRRKQSSSQDLKSHLASRLPEMLTLALEAYDRITGQPAADDPKAFTAQQGGAKAALAHMEALLKLAQSVMADAILENGADTGANKDRDGLSDLLARARHAVADSKDLEGDELEDLDEDRIGAI